MGEDVSVGVDVDVVACAVVNLMNSVPFLSRVVLTGKLPRIVCIVYKICHW